MGTTKLFNQFEPPKHLTNEHEIIISQRTSTYYLDNAREPNI